MTEQHLAEFNFGTLRHGWDDPRTKGFVDGLDLVNGIAEKAPGFIWRLTDEDMGDAQSDTGGVFGDNPRVAATLSVWKDVESLETFVWKTVHRQFYARKAEWYDAKGNGNFVMWWVAAGHRPSMVEAMDRWRHYAAQGDSDEAFGWSYLETARAWQTHACAAAE